MKVRFFVLFFMFNLLVTNVFSQEEQRCPHVPHLQDFARNQTLYQQFLNFRKLKTNVRIPEKQYVIPIIVHVMHLGEPIGEGTNISTEQIQSQIDVLNEDFNRNNLDQENTLVQFESVAGKLNIRFELADFDTIGNLLPEKGIQRLRVYKHQWSLMTLMDSLLPATIWDNTQYYNIWTVGNIQGFLGFAQFPDSSGLVGLNEAYNTPSSDGMVVDYDHFGSYSKYSVSQLSDAEPFHLGRTVTHEMGHALGLFHTWGDVSGCRGNDFCDDTPEIPSSSTGCPLDRSGCNSLAMVQNYMDYSHDDCMNIFTQCQVERMQWILENSPRRRELTEAANTVLLSKEKEIEPHIKIFPNPTDYQLHIYTEGIEIKEYELLNLLGQKVLSNQSFSEIIQLPKLLEGIYILKLKTNQGILYRKISIQH